MPIMPFGFRPARAHDTGARPTHAPGVALALLLALTLAGCATGTGTGGGADTVRDGGEARAALAAAERALIARHPRQARKALRGGRLPPELETRRLGLLAAAERLDNRPLAAAEALDALDPLLTDEPARLLNQVALLATLSQLGAPELRGLARGGRGTLRGWAEIALLARAATNDPARFEADYGAWRARAGKQHPALPALGPRYAALLTGDYGPNDRVTVLLPRAGRFREAAAAVRQGIELARRADDSGPRADLDIQDSGAPERTPALVRAAAARGADHVIGPLQKPAVDALAASRDLAIPTLALNETTDDQGAAPGLFQFALSPENEAAEAASKAAAQGYRRAILLHPRDAWGGRLAGALRERWGSLGGHLTSEAGFDPGGANQDAVVDRLVEGTDAELLFLIATAEQARRLHPRIRLVAPRLPVIATSHVHAGRFDPARDGALTGLYFVEIPWMLETGDGAPLAPRPPDAIARPADPLERLRAMGIDAWRLTPLLPALARLPGACVPGQTGMLSLDPRGRIQRQLLLARFEATGVRPVERIASRGASSAGGVSAIDLAP